MNFELGVLLAGLAVLMLAIVRGASIFVAAPLCAAGIVLLSGGNPVTSLTGAFMAGFAKYVRDFYFIFVLGAVFGKLMDISGAAHSIAQAVVWRLGTRWACLSVVLACAVLTYGGVSLFVVGFAVHPMAVHLFRQANLPRRFIPGAIGFGSITFTMTSAGSPEIQNLIPIKYLLDAKTGVPLTDTMAGWPVSIIVASVMFLLGQIYLEWAIARELRTGVRFEPFPGDRVRNDDVAGPQWLRTATPLFVTLFALNVLPMIGEHLAAGRTPMKLPADWLGNTTRILLLFREEPSLAIFAGVVTASLVLYPYLAGGWDAAGKGFVDGLIAIGSTSSVVGFGTALRDLAAFQYLTDKVTHMPGDPLINAAIAVAVIAGIAGSASGGQGLALPIVKPIFIDQLGVAPRALHRVVAIASGSLDSLPANGFVVMLIRNICGETYARAYWPLCVLTVFVPIVGTALAIVLFKLFPAWGLM